MEDLISNAELPSIIGVSLPTIYNLRKAGDFFEPVRLSKNRIMWRVSDAKAWLASR
jgi:predicted DNA-binding transcriptional regulator AlpA